MDLVRACKPAFVSTTFKAIGIILVIAAVALAVMYLASCSDYMN